MTEVEYVYVPPSKKTIDDMLVEPWPKVVYLEIPRKRRN